MKVNLNIQITLYRKIVTQYIERTDLVGICEFSGALKPVYLEHVDKGFLKIYSLK
jgi:hypothetical protein